MVPNTHSSYRPHDSGHNYYDPGIYLITLVAKDRCQNAQIFGQLNDDLNEPAVILSQVGTAILEEWNKIPAHEETKGRKIKIHAAICMPDHFHGVIEVLDPMSRSVGQVIWGFKVACTKRWRALSQTITAPPMTAKPTQDTPTPVPGQPVPTSVPGQPAPTSITRQPVPTSVPGQPASTSITVQPSLVAPAVASVEPNLHNMSARQRAEYYALHPEEQQPLFDENYDDTICMKGDGRHYSSMIQYVHDNPRRAIIRKLRPDFMQRCQRICLQSTDDQGNPVTRTYAAFGNLFLLRWPRKVQVFCHRKAPDKRTPYEQTPEYRADCIEWKRQLMEGATVMVTPGISRGEQIIKERCLESSYPLIHLQKEPIGPLWKPERKRFEACSNGSLLILAPWDPTSLGEVKGVPSQADYSIFHNLNRLAAEICRT